MDIVTLSGPSAQYKRGRKPLSFLTRLNARLTAAPAGSFQAHILKNAIARRTGTARHQNHDGLSNYKQYLESKLVNWPESSLINKLIKVEIAAIDGGKFSGTTADSLAGIGKRKKKKGFFKKLGKGLKKFGNIQKKLALAPARASAILLIALNFRGLAYKLQRTPKDKLLKKWKRLGGNPEKLFKAINKGAKKKPLLGSKTKKAIKGLEDAFYNDPQTINDYQSEIPQVINGIGVAPAAAALIAAIPVITALLKMVPKKPGEKEGIDPDTGEVLEPSAAGEKVSAVESIIEQGAALAKSYGAPSELPEKGDSYAVADAEPEAGPGAGLPTGDDEIDSSPTTSGGINPKILLIGGAAVAALLLLKNQ